MSIYRWGGKIRGRRTYPRVGSAPWSAKYTIEPSLRSLRTSSAALHSTAGPMWRFGTVMGPIWNVAVSLLPLHAPWLLTTPPLHPGVASVAQNTEYGMWSCFRSFRTFSAALHSTAGPMWRFGTVMGPIRNVAV